MRSDLNFSFEIFPPKTERGFDELKEKLSSLKKFDPQFISLTYGALQSSVLDKFSLLDHIQNHLNIPAAAHFTCVRNSPAETHDFLKNLEKRGINHIVALRGDKGGESQKKDFPFAKNLVSFIREHYPKFKIFVAGYPSGHPESGSLDNDRNYLMQKVNAGADAVITQFFFENESFFKFSKDTAQMGLSCPVIPGIMPLYRRQNLEKILSFSGLSLPPKVQKIFEEEDTEETFVRLIDFTVEQCEDLKRRGGVNIFHFYTLNAVEGIDRICSKLQEKFKRA